MAGTHSAGKEPDARLEVTADVGTHTAIREGQLIRTRGIRVRLAATSIHVVKETREREESVISTTAESRELTRQEEGPASVAAVFTVAAVSTAVAEAHIADKS
jgi:hypothetical protein